MMEINPTLATKLVTLVQQLGERHPPEELARIQGLARVLLGAEEPRFLEHQSPRLEWIFMPGLASAPYLDGSKLEWVRRLEAAADVIRAEGMNLVDAQSDRFQPYRQDSAGPPLEFDVFLLYRHFKPEPLALECCPETMRVLADCPIGEEVSFSLLKPGAHAPPHCDPFNFFVAAHLGLVIPEQVGIRVAGETRRWEEGRCMLIDVTFVHEVWNHSPEPRLILNLEAWHPNLTKTEVEVLSILGAELLPELVSHVETTL